MVQLQLAALDPAPQASGQLEPLERVGRAEAVDVHAAAGGLRLVHRGVGVLAQRLGRLRVGREEADADARVDQQLGGAERERRVHRVGDPLADGLGVLARGDRQVAHEHEELVTALPDHQVARAHRGAQPRGDLAEKLVAHVVPERVVDPLELVQVRERQRHDGAGRARLDDRLLERELERGTVRQTRQRDRGRQGTPSRRAGQARLRRFATWTLSGNRPGPQRT